MPEELEPHTERASPWYEEAFRSDYLEAYAHRDVASAKPEVEFLRRRGVGGRVLDLCCGYGRHALLMRQCGFAVFGLDLSLDLLRAAERLDGFDAYLRGRLVRADMTRVPFAERTFDAVTNLFSSFGYLGQEGDARVLHEVARVLVPAGLAVFDLMNPERVRSELVPTSRRSGPGFELWERRRLSADRRRVLKDVELVRSDGNRRRWTEDVRLYEDGELSTWITRSGLVWEGAFGDFDDTPYGPGSPRRILTLRRRR